MIKKIIQVLADRKAQKQAEIERQLRLEEEKRQEQLKLEQQRQEQARLEQEKYFKEAEERQKTEKERLLNSEEMVPEKFVIGLSVKRTATKNGITYKYNHTDYYLTEIEAWKTFVIHDKFKVKQLTGENVGAEYIVQPTNSQYMLTDYKGNVRRVNSESGPRLIDPYKVQDLIEFTKKLNSVISETAFKQAEQEQTKNKLFGK